MASALDERDITRKTGELFGDLWGPYNDQLFRESVELFVKRIDLAGVDANFVAGKRVLDAGCGGGRNSIAMAQLGAAQVEGIDVGENGVRDARKRAASFDNVTFQVASVDDIPFPDAHFDLVWCAGVLMHTANEASVLAEIARVCKPGGLAYFLVYATGGMRWPLIKLVRPLAATIGQDNLEAAMAAAHSPANKRRTFLDDLFVPKFDFFEWKRLESDLRSAGFSELERWPDKARLDHEHDLGAYRLDIEALHDIFVAGAKSAIHPLFTPASAATASALAGIDWFIQQVDGGTMTEQEAMATVIGQGHHRLLARRAG